MSLPTPKFNIGDRVYAVTTRQTYKRLPCPDCLGTKKWKVVSPAGTECTTKCPRCEHGYNNLPSLDVPHHETTVQPLTIGSIRIDTNDKEHPVGYMCNETGVGSGSIWYESKLHADYDEAKRIGEEKAAAETAVQHATPPVAEAVHFSYLAIEKACIEALRSAVFDSWYAYNNLMEKLTDFVNDKCTKEELANEIDFEKRYRQGYSSHPFDLLIKAARAHADDPAIAKALEPFAQPETKVEEFV